MDHAILIYLKLTAAQITAFDTAGAFEEPLDADDELLHAALIEQGAITGRLVTHDPAGVARVIGELSNGADSRGSGTLGGGRGADPVIELRAGYRADCQVFLRLSRKLRVIADQAKA